MTTDQQYQLKQIGLDLLLISAFLVKASKHNWTDEKVLELLQNEYCKNILDCKGLTEALLLNQQQENK
jgi:hypothetical protein